METVSLILEFEEVFNIEIDTEEMFELHSLKDLTSFLEAKIPRTSIQVLQN